MKIRTFFKAGIPSAFNEATVALQRNSTDAIEEKRGAQIGKHTFDDIVFARGDTARKKQEIRAQAARDQRRG